MKRALTVAVTCVDMVTSASRSHTTETGDTDVFQIDIGPADTGYSNV